MKKNENKGNGKISRRKKKKKRCDNVLLPGGNMEIVLLEKSCD